MNNTVTILLVDDDAIIASAESMVLKHHGYSVMTAGCGEEAIAIFEKNPSIGLVLMDIDLGEGMDGTEVAKQILKIRDVPVVFLSAHTEPEVVAKTEEITSYGYVVKSSGETVLLASIKMAFRLFDAKQKNIAQSDELSAVNEELQATIEELEATNEEFEATNEELLRANEALEKRERLLEFLNKLSKSLAAQIDVRGAVEAILDALLTIEGIECGGIYMRDLDSGGLDLLVHRGLSKNFVSRIRHYEPDSRNIQIALQGPLYTDYSEIADKSDDVRLHEGLRAIAILPVFHAGRLVAVLNLASRKLDTIPDDVRSSLEAVALQVGSALHRVQVFERLQISEARFKGLVNTMNEGLCLHELVYDEKGTPIDYRVLEVNNRYEEIVGIPAAKAVGRCASELYGTGEAPYLDVYSEVALSGKSLCFETYFPPHDKYYRVSVYSPQEGQFATVFDDITDCKKEDKHFQELAAERELMLKELRHRVKNSFAMISSLLNGIAEYESEPYTKKMLQGLEGRIGVLAELYELLHGREADSEISLREFISNIIVLLKRIYLRGDERITIELNIENIRYATKNAAALGIILHEIFVNAIKHAFPEGKSGTVQLLLEEHDGAALLKCADNGTGFPEDFDMRADGSHGLSLISKLMRQLRGEMDIKRRHLGSEITLRFPLNS